MARKTRDKKVRLLKELEENPLVTRACSRLKISRATFYRWRDQDPAFREMVAIAIERGRDKISDFAESKLYENVSNNNQQAISFVLRHNSKKYRPHAIRLYLEENLRHKGEIRSMQRLLDELINLIGVDEAIRIAGHDPEEFKASVRKELKEQFKKENEL